VTHEKEARDARVTATIEENIAAMQRVSEGAGLRMVLAESHLNTVAHYRLLRAIERRERELRSR
jgi:hypothetical protein